MNEWTNERTNERTNQSINQSNQSIKSAGGVNGHTTRSLVLYRLVSGWRLQKRRSAPPNGPSRLWKNFILLRHSLRAKNCSFIGQMCKGDCICTMFDQSKTVVPAVDAVRYVIDDASVELSERHVVPRWRSAALLNITRVLAIILLIFLHLLDQLKRRAVQLQQCNTPSDHLLMNIRH